MKKKILSVISSIAIMVSVAGALVFSVGSATATVRVKLYDMDYIEVYGVTSNDAELKDSFGNRYNDAFVTYGQSESYVVFDVIKYKSLSGTIATPVSGANGNGAIEIYADGAKIFTSQEFYGGIIKPQKFNINLQNVDKLKIVFRAASSITDTRNATIYDGYFTRNEAADEVIPIITLKKGQTMKLGATKTPVSATEAVTYKSTKTSVATITSKGLVTAVAKGSSLITMSTESGANAKIYIKVTE